MRILGIMGHAGAGKDEVAKILVRDFGYTRIAFADALKEQLLKLNPIIGPHYDWGHFAPLDDFVNDLGWDAAKREYPEVRRLLQTYGQQMRDQVSKNYWVEKARRKALALGQSASVVFTDVRYENEAHHVACSGPLLVVTRPGVGPVNDHESDRPLWETLEELRYPLVPINNNGSLWDLHHKVHYAMATQNIGPLDSYVPPAYVTPK